MEALESFIILETLPSKPIPYAVMEKFIVCTRAGRWKSAFWREWGGFVLLFWFFLMHLYVIRGVTCVSQEGNDPALPWSCCQINEQGGSVGLLTWVPDGAREGRRCVGLFSSAVLLC